MKIYSDLNIGTEAVDEGSDGIFYLKRDAWMEKKGYGYRRTG